MTSACNLGQLWPTYSGWWFKKPVKNILQVLSGSHLCLVCVLGHTCTVRCNAASTSDCLCAGTFS